MDQTDGAQNEEELERIHQRLSQEGVELIGPCPDRRPVPDEDPDRPGCRDGPYRDDRGRPDPSHVFHGAVQKAIRVEDVEQDEEGIEALRLLLRRPLPESLEFPEESQILFGDRLLDELGLTQHFLVIQYQREFYAGLGEAATVLLEDLRSGAGPVEELDQAPLRVLEVVVLDGL